MNKSFRNATIEIFNHIFTSEQIKKMIEIDLSDEENVLNLPVDKYFEKRFYIGETKNGDNENAEADPNQIILASYTPMNIPVQTEPVLVGSPGIITFYKDNIKLYINSLINCCFTNPIGLNTALYIVCFVNTDLLQHEGYHHFSDVTRQLTGSQFNLNIEDKLAVAHSYNEFSSIFKRGFNINYYFLYEKFNRLFGNDQLYYQIISNNKILFEFLLSEHFKAYQSDVYINWQLFTKNDSYETHFYDYIKNSKLDELLNLGIPVNDIQKEIHFIGVDGAKMVVE